MTLSYYISGRNEKSVRPIPSTAQRSNVPSAKKTPELLSIGELSQATGISPDTIRVWERRYGVPEPVRLPSGHRRYTPEQLRWLRRAAEAISLGHRPGNVVRASEENLQDLLDRRRTRVEAPSDVESWLELIRSFASRDLTRLLREEFERKPAGDFLTQTLSPLLVAVGRAWSDGRLEVRHEHFFSELLQDLLRSLRVSIGLSGNGPRVLLAGLSDDMHDLPVQMGALLTASKGLQPQILGKDTPIDEIARAATEMRCRGVVVPTSLSFSSLELEARVDELRRKLPDHIALCVGWHDARFMRRAPVGVKLVRELQELELWLRSLL